MKEFSRIIVGLNNKVLIDRLEHVLNKEIVLISREKETLASQLSYRE
jgi:hypothetical protein